MLNLIDSNIENYCISNSWQPNSVMNDLADYTRKNVELPQMLIGPMEASFLRMLVNITGAKRVLEFGTFTGYSALNFAEALPDDGEIFTLDINEQTTSIAKKYWAKSPAGKKIHSILGPAVQSLQQLKGKFDLVFIDADKTNYSNYFLASLELLSDRGVIVLDNMLWSGQVCDPSDQTDSTQALRDVTQLINSRDDVTACMLPIRDGITLVTKK